MRFVIVGAGTGGTLTANLLAGAARDGGLDVTITVVGDAAQHVFQPGSLDVAFRGTDPDRFIRSQAPLLEPGITFDDSGAQAIDLDAGTVTTGRGTYEADHIVLCTGAEPDDARIPGLHEAALDFHHGPQEAARIWRALEGFEGGDVVVAIGDVPYKCPPSPVEACFLLHEALEKKGIRENSTITLATPYPRAYPAAAIADQVEERFADRDIRVSGFFAVGSVDAANRKLLSLEGDELPYDLLIAVPPHQGAAVVREAGIGDDEGWIPVDRETMRITGHPAHYAIGDCTALPISKSGVVAHLEALVVVKNLLHDMGHGELFAYDGRINCPMEVGDHRLLWVSATYTQAPEHNTPTLAKYAMKKAFNRMYWKVLSGDLEWMLGAYFGPTSHPLPEAPGVEQIAE